jgi:hypothetical protein
VDDAADVGETRADYLRTITACPPWGETSTLNIFVPGSYRTAPTAPIVALGVGGEAA